MKTVKAEKNGVGYEWVTENDTQTSTVWMAYRDQDTLCFTSPEYPPRFSWKARKTEKGDWEFALKIEQARQNTLFALYLSDAKCLPEEAVSGSIADDIAGLWKLMKDIRKGTDYSCDTVIKERTGYRRRRATGADGLQALNGLQAPTGYRCR
ncbi:MAG: hypothetical protein LBU37_13315 [Tannerellaceae bacterium]|jgi:hypothetical protein|nr:hypothetical protein [Tannerellaceae bacterium]